jgi:peroxiredoxin
LLTLLKFGARHVRVRNDSFSQTMIYKSRGKLLARTLAVLLIAALAAQFLHVVLAAEPKPGTAPDFVLRDQAGQPVRLSEFRGQVVALAFSAGWCGDCDAATRALARMQESMGGDGLQMVAVSFDRDARAAGAPAARGTYPVLRDPDGEVGRLYSVNKLPSVVLIDREGRLVATQDGFQPADERKLSARIRDLLAD